MSKRYVCAALVLAGVAVPGAAPKGQAPNQASLVTQTVAGVKFSTLPGFAIERVNPPDKGDSYVVDHVRQPRPAGRVEGERLPAHPARQRQGRHLRVARRSSPTRCATARACGSTAGRCTRRARCPAPRAAAAAAAARAAEAARRRCRGINSRAGIVRLEDTNGDDVADTFEMLAMAGRDSGARSARHPPRARRRHHGHRRQQRDDRRCRARSDVAGPAGQGRAVPALLRRTSARARARARTARSSTGTRRRRSSASSRAATATPTTTPTTSPAKRSSSTATWSGTSACRGIAKCARRTRSPTATTAIANGSGKYPRVLHRLAPAGARPRPRIAGRRRVLHELRLPARVLRQPVRSRLVARPPALHGADAERRDLHARDRTAPSSSTASRSTSPTSKSGPTG